MANQTVSLPAGLVLTIYADASSAGTVVRTGGGGYAASRLGPRDTYSVGPFLDARSYLVTSEYGAMTTGISSPAVDTASAIAQPYVAVAQVGTTDASGVLSAALTLAAVTGDTVLLQRGTTYYLDASVVLAGIDIRLDFNGARVVQRFDGVAFSLSGGWANVQTATGTSAGTATIGVSDASKFAAGRVVKIVSSDRLQGTRPAGANDYLKGEFGVVASINTGANQITLTSPLTTDYSTLVRIGTLKRLSCELTSPWVDAEDGHDAGSASVWTSDHWRIASFEDVLITDYKTRKGYGESLKLVGCFYPRVIRPNISGLPDNSAAGQFGYGIDDISCEGLLVDGGVFGNVRHGTTTNVLPTTSGSTDLSTYGPSRLGKILNSHGKGTATAFFDMHHGVEDYLIFNCWGADNPNGAAVQLRGYRNKAINCGAARCRRGAYVFSETTTSSGTMSPGDYSDGCEVINFNAQKTGEEALLIKNVIGAAVRGGRFESVGATGAGNEGLALYADTCTMIRFDDDVRIASADQMNAVRFNDAGTVTNAGLISVTVGAGQSASDKGFNVEGGTTFLNRGVVTVDVTAAGATGTRSALRLGDTSSFSGGGVRVVGSPSGVTKVVNNATTGAPATAFWAEWVDYDATLSLGAVTTRGIGYPRTEHDDLTLVQADFLDGATDTYTLTKASPRLVYINSAITKNLNIVLPNFHRGPAFAFLRDTSATGAFTINIKDALGNVITSLSSTVPVGRTAQAISSIAWVRKA